MTRIGAHISVSGIVQGVGFRPFIHKQITDHSLSGWIRNTSEGAELEIEGEEEAVDRFTAELWTKSPYLAVIENVQAEKYTALKGYDGFRISESRALPKRNTLISPDVCLCEDCRRELFDRTDRRFRYPFINCTNCGPRFTIVKDVPYDRPLTTMGSFPLCEDCRKEYTEITDRRYHAQPVCCPVCGPRLLFYDAAGTCLTPVRGGAADPGAQPASEKALAMAVQLLQKGGILAVKGLGGIHLACRIDDPALALALRRRKERDEKPFAVMCRDAETARAFCLISPEEEALLTGRQRPIVLLRKKPGCAMDHISENGRIGVMLPYTPVHELLLHDGPSALIMTSANLSDRPIMFRNEEALSGLSGLSGIADGFLLNDRDIETRCDDSLLWAAEGEAYFARRSRGYAPFPVMLKEEIPPLLALGAEQKASFSLSQGHYVFLSQHIGDLKNIETLDNYELQIRHFERLFDMKPQGLITDLHPDYLSSAFGEAAADRESLPVLKVQHHHAHLASCLADNGYDGKAIGIIWDGTGLGTDGTVWGGEFLSGDARGFTRSASLRPFRLPGGDRCTRELWRTAYALLRDAQLPPADIAALLPEAIDRFAALDIQLSSGLNAPVCTSMGRLFDGAAAILGIKQTAGYEGQGAILLEAAAADDEPGLYPFEILEADGRLIFDERLMIRQMASERLAGTAPGIMAARFMNTLIRMALVLCCRIREREDITAAALSGGTFQNMYLLSGLSAALTEAGFTVLRHHRVSCNDEGLSLGQLMVGARHFSNNHFIGD